MGMGTVGSPHDSSSEISLKITGDLYRGRILKRSWTKSLKSFHPCYSQSPSHLYKPIYPPPPPPGKSDLKLVCKVNIVYGRLRPETSMKSCVHEFGFSSCQHTMLRLLVPLQLVSTTCRPTVHIIPQLFVQKFMSSPHN
jgi:hypothetical protein